MDNGHQFKLKAEETVVFIAQRVGYRGVYSVSRPIERKGKPRCNGGCSISLLCGLPVIGDPCLNHLHFHGGIHQTDDTQPSPLRPVKDRNNGWIENTVALIMALSRAIGKERFRSKSESYEVIFVDG